MSEKYGGMFGVIAMVVVLAVISFFGYLSWLAYLENVKRAISPAEVRRVKEEIFK